MIDVVCAVIFHEGQVLCAKRGPNRARPNEWEFPGGKVDKGETEVDALTREIAEELGTEIRIEERLDPIEHAYPDVTIRLIPYLAVFTGKELTLVDHAEVVWVSLDDLGGMDFSEADRLVVKQVHSPRTIQKLREMEQRSHG